MFETSSSHGRTMSGFILSGRGSPGSMSWLFVVPPTRREACWPPTPGNFSPLITTGAFLPSSFTLTASMNRRFGRYSPGPGDARLLQHCDGSEERVGHLRSVVRYGTRGPSRHGCARRNDSWRGEESAPGGRRQGRDRNVLISRGDLRGYRVHTPSATLGISAAGSDAR